MTMTTAAPSLNDLRHALETASNIAADTFDEIEALAKTALAAMRAPDGHDTHTLANLLRCLAHLASSASNCVSWEAESVGVQGDTEEAVAHREALLEYERRRECVVQKSPRLTHAAA